MEEPWIIVKEPATKAQRHALYRLGYGSWLVHRLSKEEAAEAIQHGIELMSKVKADQQDN